MGDCIKWNFVTALGLAGGALVSAVIILSVLISVFVSPFITDTQTEWFSARESQCFAAGGEYARKGKKTRCVHRDGRIDLHEWRDL